ncbi:hypothetical protein RCG23_16860 [Neobacillus sp. PS3-34]|uniref:hypothetical protein n=1 Tax=Neobacillus sp. PS3-34 TaxID=3070678 RepID=UPI0027DF1355|nr:hypothetical protein [Neobacillus sp. PS3-34]WML47216.1 hypothetical protein RCG23_16860 [Neobacillus sp. PS3-34]
MANKSGRTPDITVKILYGLNYMVIILLFLSLWIITHHPEYIKFAKKILHMYI